MFKFLSTLFYIGYLPRFQASTASLIGFALFHALHQFSKDQFFLSFAYSIALIAGMIAVYFFLKSPFSSKDPKEVVLDEFFAAGLIPFFFSNHLIYGIITLSGFRVLDILKPGIIKKIENIKNWSSIYLDDFAAVLIAIFAVKIIELFFEYV